MSSEQQNIEIIDRKNQEIERLVERKKTLRETNAQLREKAMVNDFHTKQKINSNDKEIARIEGSILKLKEEINKLENQ